MQTSTGSCLGTDLIVRMENIMQNFFQPEWRCFEEFSKSGKAPIVNNKGVIGPADCGTIFLPAIDETTRRMRASGFPLELTSCLVRDGCQHNPEDEKHILSFFSKGGNFEKVGTMCW